MKRFATPTIGLIRSQLLAVFCFNCWLAFSSSLFAAQANLEFAGRWQLTDDVAWSAWQGSTVRLRFRGTGVVAEFESDRTEYLRVIVDGNQAASQKVKLRPGRHNYQLVAKLPAEEHVVEVVKETYRGPGRWTVHKISTVDGGVLLPYEAVSPRLKLQFYGDSNLAGDSLENEKNSSRLEHVGCHRSFAGIAARMLDAEYQNISSSGATIAGQPNSVLSFFDRVDFYSAEPKWDFRNFPADVCVVNIGANDIGKRSKEDICRQYLQLLRTLRTAHPHAHLVVMNAYGWDRNEPANYTDEVVAEFDDDNVSRLLFPWLFNEWHGCEYDHAGMAVTLVDHLGRLNPKWRAKHAADVMDGFGRNGDVANGSFEKVAPFGGFGWRYMDDGVQRVAIEDAADGRWCIRLPEGTQVHQPNPASPEGNYQYRLKLRSIALAGKVKLRVEFRDQQWRHDLPSLSHEKLIDVDDDWKEYTVSAEAGRQQGDRTAQPFQVLLRIIAARGTIECDDVRLQSR